MGRTPNTNNDKNFPNDSAEQAGGKRRERGPDRRQDPNGPLPEGVVVDRRLGLGRREGDTGLERKRGPGRRLSEFTRSAEEGEMTPEQFLFLIAIDEFKKVNDKPYPTWSDVLEVVRLLGYRKTCASELTLPRAEDWTERGDAPSNVRPDNWEKRSERDTGKRARLSEAQALDFGAAALAGEGDSREELAAYDFDLDDFEEGMDDGFDGLDEGLDGLADAA